MSYIANLKTPYVGFYQNRSKVQINYMVFYIPIKTVVQPSQSTILNLGVSMNMTTVEGEYVPFDIIPPKVLSSQLQFIINPIQVNITSGMYQVNIEIKNLSSSSVVLLPGSVIAQIIMDKSFKVVIKNE